MGKLRVESEELRVGKKGERRGGGGEWNWRFLYTRKGFRFSVKVVKIMNCDKCAKMTRFDRG